MVAVRARPDAQRDDPRRHVAGGRHPRRRRHRGDREHPPQPGAEEAHPPRHPRRRAGDRGARAGLHAVHLHRLRARWRSSPARRDRSSSRWRWRWSSPCSPRTCSRARWCRRWSATCSRARRRPTSAGHHGPTARRPRGAGASRGFDHGFDRLRTCVRELARPGAPATARCSSSGFAGFVVASLSLFPCVGRDFFPSVDAGLIKLHVRGPPGTRIEETEKRWPASRTPSAASSPRASSRP